LTPPEGNLLADKNQAWWDEQEFSELTAFQVQLDLEIITQLETQKAKIDQKLAELSDTQPWADEMVFLMQIPGFGLLTSMILLAAIGDISRFSHPKKLVGYAGLGAGVHDSGQKHQEKSITKAGRKELRWALVQAAWAAVRSDPYWKTQYKRLTKVKHPNVAIVATPVLAAQVQVSLAVCWSPPGISSPNTKLTLTSMKKPLLTRCLFGHNVWMRKPWAA